MTDSSYGRPGPKPYATATWTYSQVVEEIEEEEEEEDEEVSDALFQVTPQPYASASWTFFQDVVEIDEGDVENDESPALPWFDTIGQSELVPYATNSWAYYQTTIEEEDILEPGLLGFDISLEWWETIENGQRSPYSTASWTYHQEVSVELEFVPVSLKRFFTYDEEYYPRTKGLGVILDSGYFGQIGGEVFDSAYYEGSERGILMKRKLARVFVYDQLADSPGNIPSIPQPIGNLTADPAAGDLLTTNPQAGEIGTEVDSVLSAVVGIDLNPPGPFEIECDGDLEGSILEAARNSNSYDDRPPGTLLGSVSYEIFGDIATITDWEHLNWQDDTPVLKAVQVIINELPDCVTEVKVLDPPHAFWTSLGFNPDYKGDPYLHLYLV